MRVAITLLFSLVFSFSFSQIEGTFSGTGLPIAQNTWDTQQDIIVPVSGLTSPLAAGSIELIQANIEIQSTTSISTSVSYKIISPSGTEIIIKPLGYSGPSSIKHFDVKFRDPCTQGGCDWFTSMSDLAGFSIAEPWSTGFHRPETSCTFDDVNGENPNGNWIVRFEESSSFDEPAIVKVELIFGLLHHVDITNNPPNEDCSTPHMFCEDFPVCYNNSGMSGNPSTDPAPGLGGCAWNLSLDNTGWFSWIATSTTAHIEVSGLQSNQQIIAVGNLTGSNTCDANDLYLLDGGCPEDAVNYNPGYSNGDIHNMELNVSNLTIGETYYFIFDGDGGSVTSAYLTIEGAENCIVECNISGITATATCPDATGNYTVSGSISFTNAPATGTLSITDDISGITQTFNAPFNTNPQAYSLNNIPYDGLQHTLTAVFSDENTCSFDVNYTPVDNTTPTFTQISPICSGDALSLPNTSDNGITGTWSPAEDNTATTNYTFTPDAGQCATNATMTVIVNDAVSVSNINEICETSQTDYTVTFDISGGDFSSYVVNPTGSGTISGATFSSNTISSGSSYSFTVTDANGCNPVVVDGTHTCDCPVIGSISGDATICVGESTDLSFSYSGGIAPYNLVYSDGVNDISLNGLTGTSTTVSVSPTTNTSYTLVSVEDASCVGTVSGTATITVKPLPTLSLSSDVDICLGTSTDIIVSFTGTANYGFTVNGASQSGITDNPYTFTVNPTSNTNYTFTNVNDNFCSDNINETVSINVHDAVSVNNISSNCLSGNSNYEITFDISGGDAASYSVMPSGTLSGNLFTSNPIASGTNYSFTVTDQYNCNPQTVSGSVDCSCPITANISGSQSICEGSSANISIDLSGGNFPYNIVYSDGTNNYNATANSSPFTIAVSPSISTTYTLVSVSDANCVGSVSGSATITVNPLPTVQLINNHEICLGTSVDLNFVFSGSSPFTIDYTDGINTFTQTGIVANPYNLSVTPNISKTYSVISIVDAYCTGTASGSSDITVHQLPNVDAGLSQEVCFGETVTLSASGANSYIWDNNVQNNLPFSPQATNSYTVTGTDAFGCTATDQVDVTVNPLPTANAGTDQVICEGETATLTASGGLAYIWNTSETSNSINVSPNNTTSYSVTVSDANNCASSDNVNVLVNANPIVNAGADQDICLGESVNLTAISNGASNYVWSHNLGNTQDVSASPASTTTYTVSVSDNVGCVGTDDVTINVFDANSIQVTPSDTLICFGESVVLSASGGADSYTWFPTYGLSQNTGSTVVANPTQSTSYTVVGDFGPGCSANTNVWVQVDKIVVQLAQQNTLCNGDILTLQASVTDGIAPYSYLWEGTTNTSSEITEQLFSDKSFTVFVTDSAGCSSSATEYIYVHDSLKLKAYANVDSICPGKEVLVNAVISGGTGSPYQLWIDGDYSQTIATVLVNQTHDFVFTAQDGCMQVNDTLRINTYPIPYLDFAANINAICEEEAIKFTSIVQPEYLAQSYKWNFGDNDNNNLSFAKHPTHIYKQAGLFHVSLQLTTIDGCVLDTTKYNYIHVDAKPNADFKAMPEITSILKPEIYFNNLSEGANFYYWDFGTGDASNLENPVFKYRSVGNYEVTLIAESNFGCKDTAYRNVRIEPEIRLWFPNAFSPDGDNINEFFLPKGSNIINKDYELIIYDRWGEPIFTSNDIELGWDGKAKGNDYVKPGIYTYTVRFKDIYEIAHEQAGTINVIR